MKDNRNERFSESHVKEFTDNELYQVTGGANSPESCNVSSDTSQDNAKSLSQLMSKEEWMQLRDRLTNTPPVHNPLDLEQRTSSSLEMSNGSNANEFQEVIHNQRSF